MSTLDEIAAEVVRRTPDPPRDVPTWSLIRRAYLANGSRWVAGFGLFVGVPTTVLASLATGPLWQRAGLAGFSGALSLFFIILPAIGALRLSRALRSAIRVEAQILTVTWSASIPATVEAARNGLAVGKRRVFHPAGAFDQGFESDSSWARSLTPGTPVALLADRTAPRVRFDLGPTEAQA